LEIGFGTGLNALLTCLKAAERQQKIYYETLELYPLSQQEIQQLNYPDILPYAAVSECFSRLHSTAWNKKERVSENFTLYKRQISAIGATYPAQTFDLVYFDAFSPEAQPELWTEAVFKPIYNAMKNKSILLTYCTKGIVKQQLKALGFQIEKLSGPVGKREILRAIKW